MSDLNGVKETNRKEAFSKNGIPPRLFDSSYALQRSMVSVVSNILLNSDVAYRRDRNLQRMMRHDPDVMAPLFQRYTATTLLDWEIAPEDETSARQRKQADELKNIITQYTPRWHEFLRHLMEAVWYGPSAANALYERVDGGRIAMTDWLPMHPDSVVFDDKGKVGLRVGFHFKGKKEKTWDGWAKMLTPTERKAVILHRYYMTGADYDDPFDNRYVYSGRGLRDICWFQWLIKQKVLQLWVTFAERYGMGIREITYPEGNAEAQELMEIVAQNLIGDVTILRPSREDATHDPYGVNIHEASTAQASTFANLIEGYLAGQLKEMIIGQTATSEPVKEGLGAGVSEQHAITFSRIVKFDALSLQDTLNREFIKPLHEMNFGETSYCPRFEFAIPEQDPTDWIEGVKTAYDMGVLLSERQLRQRLGLKPPGGDETPIERPEEAVMGAALGGVNTSDPDFKKASQRNDVKGPDEKRAAERIHDKAKGSNNGR